MRKLVLIQAMICCLFSFCEGQGLVNNYLYGYDNWPKALLNFPNNQPVTYIDSTITMGFSYAHANISDSAGNLLFYTNGIVVMDGNHDTMPNGRGLNPCQYTTQFQYDGLSLPQADLILPDPGNINPLEQRPGLCRNERSYSCSINKLNMKINDNGGTSPANTQTQAQTCARWCHSSILSNKKRKLRKTVKGVACVGKQRGATLALPLTVLEQRAIFAKDW